MSMVFYIASLTGVLIAAGITAARLCQRVMDELREQRYQLERIQDRLDGFDGIDRPAPIHAAERYDDPGQIAQLKGMIGTRGYAAAPNLAAQNVSPPPTKPVVVTDDDDEVEHVELPFAIVVKR